MRIGTAGSSVILRNHADKLMRVDEPHNVISTKAFYRTVVPRVFSRLVDRGDRLACDLMA